MLKKKVVKKEVEEEEVEIEKKEKKIEFTQAEWDAYVKAGTNIGIVKSFPQWLKEQE